MVGAIREEMPGTCAPRMGIWLVQLPAAYLLSRDIGLEGVWLGYPVGFAAALLAQAMYYGLIWRRRRIEIPDVNVKEP